MFCGFEVGLLLDADQELEGDFGSASSVRVARRRIERGVLLDVTAGWMSPVAATAAKVFGGPLRTLIPVVRDARPEGGEGDPERPSRCLTRRRGSRHQVSVSPEKPGNGCSGTRLVVRCKNSP